MVLQKLSRENYNLQGTSCSCMVIATLLQTYLAIVCINYRAVKTNTTKSYSEVDVEESQHDAITSTSTDNEQSSEGSSLDECAVESHGALATSNSELSAEGSHNDGVDGQFGNEASSRPSNITLTYRSSTLSNDIGLASNNVNAITQSEKYEMLINPFKPDRISHVPRIQMERIVLLGLIG